LDDGVVYLLLPVADDDGSVGAEHVDVLVAVDIAHAATRCALEEDGVFAGHEVVGTADAHHAAGYELLGFGVQLLGP
jgi:hypothetical protein